MSAEPKQAWSNIKNVEKDLLPATGKENMGGVISKAISSSNKGRMRICFGN
jgi:hypothetical protein